MKCCTSYITSHKESYFLVSTTHAIVQAFRSQPSIAEHKTRRGRRGRGGGTHRECKRNMSVWFGGIT